MEVESPRKNSQIKYVLCLECNLEVGSLLLENWKDVNNLEVDNNNNNKNNTFLKMNIVIYPRSVIVPEPAREGQFGNVESKTEVGVSCEQSQAAADEEISEKDHLDEKCQAKISHDGASEALGTKLFSAGLAESQHFMPPRIFLH